MRFSNSFFLPATFLLCCSFLFASTTLAEDVAACAETTLTDFITCVGDNPCTCSNCGTTSTDFDGTFPTTCAVLEEYLCPPIVCCSACTASLLAYTQCAAVDIFNEAGLVSDGPCTLTCSSYPVADEVDPTCDIEDYPCTAEQADYASCLLSCTLGDDCTETLSPAADLAGLEAELANGQDTCSTYNLYACSSGLAFNGCCPECDGLYANIFQCLANEDLGEACTIECADGGTVTPNVPTGNGSPSEAPAVAPPTSAEQPTSIVDASSDPPTSAANGSEFAGKMVFGTFHAVKMLLLASVMVAWF